MKRMTFGSAGETPGRELARFVTQLKELLRSLVNDQECSNLFYPEMLSEIRNAWPEIESRFGEYESLVSDADPKVLEHHGLTGGQLRFKFDAINFIGSRFFEFFFGGRMAIARKWLKKLLEIINKLFRSLLAAVPGGGAIEEYKDILESLVPDDDKD